MKVAVLTGIKQIEMREVSNPVIQNDTDVLIKMMRVGVCGSDVHYYKTGRIGSQVVDFPFVVGHEGSGLILKVGKKVSRVKVGDQIAIEPAMPCGVCDQCKSGRPHTCRNSKFLGCPGQSEGCLTEYIVMPESSCFVIPKEMNLDQAALVEPLSIGTYAVKLANDVKDKKIAILGYGPIGYSVQQVAKYKGAKDIYVTDLIDERLAIAKKQSVSFIGNPNHKDIVKEIIQKEPLQLDIVFECCGKQEATDEAIELLKPGGLLVLVGIPEFDRISFSSEQIRRKEITIQNVRRQNHCVNEAIELIATGKVDVDSMVSHNFGFNYTNDAFDVVEGYKEGVMKAMIDFTK